MIQIYLNNLYLVLFLAFTGYCLNSLTAYKSVHYTTAINASFIASFNPIVFAILAYIFYREKLSLIQGVGIATSMFGVFWLVFHGKLKHILNLQINPGDAIMLISVLSFAVHSLLLKKKTSAFPRETILVVLTLGGIITSIPFFIVENIYTDWYWLNALSFKHLLSIFALGVFPSLLSFYCWNKGLDKVTTSQAAIFLNLIPVFTTLLSILFLGEQLQLFHIWGGLFISLGVILVNNNQLVLKRIEKLGFSHSK